MTNEAIIKMCKDLINSSTKESLLCAIESVSRGQGCIEVTIPDLVDLMRLVELLENTVSLNSSEIEQKGEVHG